MSIHKCGVSATTAIGNGEGPGVAGEVWAMGRDLEWLERCGQWGGTWSGWRGVGNGEGPGVTGEVWAMGRDLEWLERCGQWGVTGEVGEGRGGCE